MTTLKIVHVALENSSKFRGLEHVNEPCSRMVHTNALKSHNNIDTAMASTTCLNKNQKNDVLIPSIAVLLCLGGCYTHPCPERGRHLAISNH